jgi:hypothetical protein
LNSSIFMASFSKKVAINLWGPRSNVT